jgi:hypothetical protein
LGPKAGRHGALDGRAKQARQIGSGVMVLCKSSVGKAKHILDDQARFNFTCVDKKLTDTRDKGTTG